MQPPQIAVPLSPEYTANCDLHAFERLMLNRFWWKPQIHKRAGKVYAVTYLGSPVYLHRLLTGAVKGQVVDHIDGNGLNNASENLRLCTPGQNRANCRKDRDNRSGYKGVTWARTSRKWMAQIVVQGKKQYLGVFVDKVRAAKAYDREAKKAHGEFAGLNFPKAEDFNS